MSSVWVNIAYLIAAALFIFGLKNLSHPRTAVRGNILGSMGMLVAVVVTLFNQQIIGFEFIIAGLVVGGLVGAVLAIRIQMTDMPQLVAIFNGFGGGASALVAGGTLMALIADSTAANFIMPPDILQSSIATAASGLIGALTLFGSFIAFGKLQGIMTDKPILLPGRHVLNIVLLLATIGVAVWLVMNPLTPEAYLLLVVLASILGITLVIPIGGADMPVVISLLNSYSGLAASATGFVLNNSVLIIAGSLVGAAGLILTHLMCVAMNRSLPNVIFGGVGVVVDKGGEREDIYEGKVKSTSPEEVAMLMEGAGRVVIVPGYGMAVAQAQHAVRDLMNLLEARGVNVEFAIHPVAGRMPGHMNVLLAEADVPYDKLIEMDMINPTLEQADVVIVLGANDVVNPLARQENDPSNPIAGMPIIDVDKARTVVVIKRSLSPGFAGIPNPLFAADNNLMLFGDGKQAILEMTTALKSS